MYKEHFGLRENPFSIAPDPRYLFMSEGHREALAHLEYGMRGEGGGFVLLTGEVGTGKTTICKCMLEQVTDNAEVAFILNPKLTVGELLAAVCDELGISYPEGNCSVKIFVDKINKFLLDAHDRGRKTVLIIEEAQNLGPEVLEQLRLLTNLETSRTKLLQIIMVGQPELRDMLSKPELRQLSQRITARYHLGPLTRNEVLSYVAHRLSVAGGHAGLLPAPLIGKIFRLTGGVPRLINILCDRALLGGYVEGKGSIDRSTLTRAAREVLDQNKPGVLLTKRYVMGLAGLLVTLGAALGAAHYNLLPGHGRGIPVHAGKGQVTLTVPARPALDMLWWLDERSLPGKSLKGHARREGEIGEWAVTGRFQKQATINDSTEPKNSPLPKMQKSESAAAGSGD